MTRNKEEKMTVRRMTRSGGSRDLYRLGNFFQLSFLLPSHLHLSLSSQNLYPHKKDMYKIEEYSSIHDPTFESGDSYSLS